MKDFWFSKKISRWELWATLISGFALGAGHMWIWLGVLIGAAVVEGIVGVD